MSGLPVKDEILKDPFKVNSEEKRTLKLPHLWKKHYFFATILVSTVSSQVEAPFWTPLPYVKSRFFFSFLFGGK